MESINSVLKQRILNGVKHFEDIPPSKWNVATISHAKVLFGLVEQYMNGEKVQINDLKEEPRGYEAAKLVFEESV